LCLHLKITLLFFRLAVLMVIDIVQFLTNLSLSTNITGVKKFIKCNLSSKYKAMVISSTKLAMFCTKMTICFFSINQLILTMIQNAKFLYLKIITISVHMYPTVLCTQCRRQPRHVPGRYTWYLCYPKCQMWCLKSK